MYIDDVSVVLEPEELVTYLASEHGVTMPKNIAIDEAGVTVDGNLWIHFRLPDDKQEPTEE